MRGLACGRRGFFEFVYFFLYLRSLRFGAFGVTTAAGRGKSHELRCTTSLVGVSSRGYFEGSTTRYKDENCITSSYISIRRTDVEQKRRKKVREETRAFGIVHSFIVYIFLKFDNCIILKTLIETFYITSANLVHFSEGVKTVISLEHVDLFIFGIYQTCSNL
ncbi:uncharacterized protein LOC124179798 isoform X1 [Neodiprion fabricii]|uniref:uncharacterized protein LOC124179798 isoform X1 n=1 Tax=Neodiprion fabricii TaxID=2872261 RepID=UPI001ED8CDB8|nr:uncharacterized protein LOC124179798 isoform X1 [Neodiprion fabricii]